MYNGIYTPSVTLLTESGEIDYSGMQKHIDTLISGGVNGILFLGSIGEFYAFTLQEKKALINFAVKAVDNRVNVIIGTGSTIMAEVIELTQYAKEAGADAAMLIAPYYFGPSHQTALKFFGDVANSVDLPIFLYNFPARNGIDLTPELVKELATQYSNIVGIKDTVDCISHTRKIIQTVRPHRPDFVVFSGFDEYYVANRISGGNGILSGLTNVTPDLFAELHKAYENNDFATVNRLGSKVVTLMKLYDVADFFVNGIKASIKFQGATLLPDSREPSVGITNEQKDQIKNIIEEAYNQ